MNSMPGLSIEFSDNNNYICRHIATDKNELNIHGRSSKTKRGRWAETQLTQLETFCKEKGIRSIQYGDTPQCSITADLICRRTGLQRSLLNLQPFDLGEFAGLSHLDLLTKNRHLGLALERFRYRVSSYADSGLANFSDPADLTLQIRSWLEELQRTGPSDTLFVLSNSLIVKTVNALH